ncbi:hypothetical protein ENH_00066350 [Eimeria necatrix]|uniref:Uncharacterized protein n=1 Tax=Eimeria necatrix TaxID=51315 RepID=U6N1Q1_9EIME|nr:hypothetical protein ENH_00066350 [Eimeria necatrix]CDJ69233.1 hypothetical protein ENH_00066350 [Eimeria necatrix]
MLTYGASLEEVPPVKEIILEVRMAYMELNHEAIALIENKNKVSIAFMYKGEDLSHVCGDARRICYRVFRKKIDDTSVHLTVNSIFQLPFCSTFPMAAPSLELYVMLESLSNLRKCVASARISLGRRCRSLSSLLSTNSYTLYLGTNSVTEAGSFMMSVRLGHTSVKAKSFSFYWSQELRSGLDEHKQGRNFPNFPTKAGEDARATLTILRQTRKTLFEHRVGAISVPVSRKPEFDLKGLTARIDELLVQMERDGVIVVPMITRLKAGTLKPRDCSTNRFASFFLDSHPYRILATTPIPFFSPDTVMKAMDTSIHERTSTHGFLGWDRCLSNTFDYLLDRAAFLDSTAPSKSGLCLASNTSLHKCVLSTCQAVSCASTYSFYSAQFAVQILEEAVFEPTAESVLIGALPFDSTQESTDLQKFEQADTDRGDHSSQKDGLDKKPVLPPVNHTHLREIRSSMDTWRHRCYFRRLPSEHPLQIFALFKRDQLFVSRQAIGQSRSGILLAILVLGDENVDVEEASKLYGVEIQTQRMINDAIVALKKRAAEGTTGKSKSTQRRSLTSLNTVLMTAVDYKGFRVVVLPLPESIPEVVAWPQPLSARVRHEVSFIETKLNICNLLKPVSSERHARDVTILLSVKNRGTDTMMLYRTCYALPLFSGKDVSGPRPSVSQRLRTVPFEYSADMEMALKNSQQLPPQMTAKPTQPDQTFQDAIVRSPFSRLYSPVDELVHFITRSYSRSYRENVEPVICGNSLPGRKAQRLGTIVKSVVLDE